MKKTFIKNIRTALKMIANENYFYLASLSLLLFALFKFIIKKLRESSIVRVRTERYSNRGNHFKVVDHLYPLNSKRSFRILAIVEDNVEYWQSGIYIESRQALFAVHNVFWVSSLIMPLDNLRLLVLGGGGSALPEAVVKKQEKAGGVKIVDVVEIDDVAIDLSKEYFVTDPSLVRFFNLDALNFISSCSEKYNIIYLDIFTNPYSTFPRDFNTTIWRKTFSLLSKQESILFINLNSISPLEVSEDIRSLVRSSFETVIILYPIDSTNEIVMMTNHIDEYAFIERFAQSNFRSKYLISLFER